MQTSADRTVGSARRRGRDVLLLALNLTLLVAGVLLVASRTGVLDLYGPDAAPPPLVTADPLPIAPRARVRSVPAPGAVPAGLLPRSRQRATGPRDPASTGEGDGAAPPAPATDRAETVPAPAAGPPDVARGTPVAARAAWLDASAPTPDPSRLRGRGDDRPHDAAPPALPPTRPREAVQALAATEAAIDRIGVEIEVLHAIRGAYPSSAGDYGANRGVESLHAALAKLGKTAGLRVGDTDDDGRLEILDAWGRPLVYFSPDDYDSVQRWAPGDGDPLDVAPRRSRDSRTVRAASTYQLWSSGPDGAFGDGPGDDVTSWVSRD